MRSTKSKPFTLLNKFCAIQRTPSTDCKGQVCRGTRGRGRRQADAPTIGTPSCVAVGRGVSLPAPWWGAARICPVQKFELYPTTLVHLTCRAITNILKLKGPKDALN